MIKLVLIIFSLLAKASTEQRILDFSMELAFMEEIQELKANYSRVNLSGGVESKVIFYLFTRRSITAEILNPRDHTTLKRSKFNKETPTKVLVHGFFGKTDKPTIQNIKDNFLKTQDVNVIAADWSSFAINVDYFMVARQTRKVGSYLAELLDLLVSEGCSLDDFHLIGHSLGAHVAGFAGSLAKSGKPARITGLDPARPGFQTAGPSERLDATDALFVDCIHTCGNLLGLQDPICAADFYPNGGKHAQPGCLFIDFGKCSHMRSHEYFAESIVPGHVFPALECPSVTEDPGDCVESKHVMGNYLKPSARGKFYILTNSQFPYAPIH